MGRGSSKAGGGGGGAKAKINLSEVNDMIKTSPSTALSQLSSVLQSGTISKAKFTANGSSVSQQTVTVKSGNDELQVYFSSGYSPQQATNPTQAIKSGIYATTWHDGNVTSYRVLSETKTKSVKNAKKNYDETLETWKKVTGQKQITF